MDRKTLSVPDYDRLVKNSLWIIISNLSLVFTLALTVLASRVLGDSVFGQYIFLLAIATVVPRGSAGLAIERPPKVSPHRRRE